MLAACGVPSLLLPPEAAAERWPSFDFAGAGPVLYHPEAGVIDPRAAMAAMVRLAAARGADVRFGTPVTRLAAAPGGDGAVAHTDSGTFAAPVVAVAAGAWTAPLLGGLVGLPPLTVTQQSVFHFAPAPGRPGAREGARGPHSSTGTGPTTSTGCPAAATARCPARSRSASTRRPGSPPRTGGTSRWTRPSGPGWPASSAAGSPAWPPARSTR